MIPSFGWPSKVAKNVQSPLPELTFALVCSSQWSYLWGNQMPALNPVRTRLTCSDPVHSRFWSCLKWTHLRFAAKHVPSRLRSQLQPILISDQVLPTLMRTLPVRSRNRFPSISLDFLRVSSVPRVNTSTPQWCCIRNSILNSSFVYDSLNKGLLFIILSSLSVSFV